MLFFFFICTVREGICRGFFKEGLECSFQDEFCNVVPAGEPQDLSVEKLLEKDSTPVLEEVVSKEEAMTPSEIPQLSRASFHPPSSSWFPSSWMATTASLLTFKVDLPTGEGEVVLDGRSPLLSCSCSSPLCCGI